MLVGELAAFLLCHENQESHVIINNVVVSGVVGGIRGKVVGGTFRRNPKGKETALTFTHPSEREGKPSRSVSF